MKAQEIRIRTGHETVELEAISDSIIRVVAYPGEQRPEKRSYMVMPGIREEVACEVREDGSGASLDTGKIRARVDGQTGQVSFMAPSGEVLLEEIAGWRHFQPAEVMGEQTCHIQQAFDGKAVRGIHGLGGNQDGIANYKGKDALLLQYNVVDVNTFFLTDRNWGLLWDNNSITHFGDPRDYGELDIFNLFAADGTPGGLTATYFSRPDFREEYACRVESAIAYDFLEDMPKGPEGFSFATGSVRWEGEFSAKVDGTHKFQLYGSSYAKVWIDDLLMADRWHQNWMPWTNLFQMELRGGERHTIRIEWVCDSGYQGLHCLSPEPAGLDETILLTSEVGEMVDYYFVHGETPDAIIRNYRRLTGPAPMMPRWAYGFWQSRERYKTQDELLDTVREFRRRGIPLDAIVQDWNYWPEDEWGNHSFDPARFPDPEGMNRVLHDELNTKIMISVWPKFYEGIRRYREMEERGFLYPYNIEQGSLDWIGKGYTSTFYDAFNPAAGDLFWKGIHDELFTKGFDAWWLDATEPDVHSNTSVEERKRRMHPTHAGSAARNFNAYSINNSRAVYEGQRAADPDKRVFILTRSSFPGQQRYAAATWSGDVASRWEDFRNQVTFVTNFSAAGIPYVTTDIGGFAVEKRYENRDPEHLEEFRELHIRWYQFGAFNPLFRVHGQLPFREIFHIAPDDHPAYRSALEYSRLRYRLFPYIYSLAGEVAHAGGSILRPLAMEFPGDQPAWNIADQFLFGKALMVCPVTEFQARERQVYLPEGAGWYDFHTGRKLDGGQWLTANAPLEDLPLYAREGTILLFGPDMEWSGEKPADPVEIRIYGGADAEFSLYEDDGLTYGYERDECSRIHISWNEDSRTLTIGKREGSFDGMLVQRQFNVVLAEGQSPADRESPAAIPSSIAYCGDAVSVKL